MNTHMYIVVSDVLVSESSILHTYPFFLWGVHYDRVDLEPLVERDHSDYTCLLHAPGPSVDMYDMNPTSLPYVSRYIPT